MALRNCSLNLKHFDQNGICFYLRSNNTFRIEILSSEGRRQLSWVRRRRIASWKRQRTFTSAQKHAARESYPNFQTRAVDNLKWGQSNFGIIPALFQASVTQWWATGWKQWFKLSLWPHICTGLIRESTLPVVPIAVRMQSKGKSLSLLQHLSEISLC